MSKNRSCHVIWQQKDFSSTCVIVFIGLFNFVDKSEADLTEKVHEERPVEVLAHLVENKPERVQGVSRKVCWKKFSHQSPSLAALTKALIWSTWVILNCLIFSFTLFLKINLGGLLEVLIKPHGEQVVTQPGWPGIFLFFFFRPGMEWNLNQHLHWMARYRRRTNPMMRRRRNHHQRTKNTW